MSCWQAWVWGFLTVLHAITVHAQNPPSTAAGDLQSRPLYRSLQASLDLLSRAEIACEEAILLGKDSKQFATIRDQCRAAIKQLRSIDTLLQQLLRKNYQLKPSQRDRHGWNVPELESLRRNVRVQLARGYRNQALCYAENSVDRINSLSLALEQLENVLTQPLDEASVWQARVEQVICLRLANQWAQAHEQIDRWLEASPSPRIRSRLHGQLLCLHLDRRQVDLARQFAQELQRDLNTAPETEEAILETRLASNQMQRATEQLHHIAATQAPYWKRRAELRLGLAVAEQSDSADLHLLNLAAASLYAAGKTDEAVAMYDRIAKRSADQADQSLHFQALCSAAAIVQSMEQPAAALQRFRELALHFPRRAEAPTLHLTSVGLAAELLKNAQPEDRGNLFEQYLALLREHLQRWPNSPSAPQVQQWLSRTQTLEIKQQRAAALVDLGERAQAIALYRQLVQASPSDGQLCEMYAQLLQQGQAEAELRESLRVWQQVEQRSKPGSPRWWRGRRARLALLQQLGEGGQAEKLEQLTEILYDRDAGFAD